MRLILDRAHGRLRDDRGNGFDSATRQWQPDTAPTEGDPVTPIEALLWLQHASGRPLRTPVAVIGTRTPTPAQERAAEETGLLLARHGLTVLCGGRAGVMEAVCRGVAEGGGLSIGLLPDTEPEAANSHVTVPLATGIGVARNALIARAAHSLIAIGGGYGTLSEIAFALQFGRPVFLLEGAPAVEGAASLANPDEALEQVARAVLRLPASGAA